MANEFRIFNIEEKSINKRLGLVERLTEKYKYDEPHSYIKPSSVDYVYVNPRHTMAVHPKTHIVKNLIENETDFNKEKAHKTSKFIQILTRYGLNSKKFKDKYGGKNIDEKSKDNLWCNDAINEFHMDFGKCVQKNFIIDLTMFAMIFEINFKVYSSRKMPLVFESDELNVVISPKIKRRVNEINMY